jgi:hypothetical protein
LAPLAALPLRSVQRRRELAQQRRRALLRSLLPLREWYSFVNYPIV